MDRECVLCGVNYNEDNFCSHFETYNGETPTFCSNCYKIIHNSSYHDFLSKQIIMFINVDIETLAKLKLLGFTKIDKVVVKDEIVLGD